MTAADPNHKDQTMAKFDAFKFAARDEGREKADGGRLWYTVDPDLMYPAVIAHVRDGGVRQDAHLLAHASPINALKGSAAWDDALKALSEIDGLTPQRRAARATCLEHARRYFTAVLHRAAQDEHGAVGIGLKITKSDRWRL